LTNQRIIAYVACADSKEIRVYRVDCECGDLRAMQQIAVNGKAMPLAVSPDRRFLYAALRSEPYAVASFAIDGLSGKLCHLADTPLPASMATINTDRSGRFLLCASTLGSIREDRRLDPSGDIISVSPIGPHGVVQPCQQTLRAGPKMHAILADPSNRHVIGTSCDGDFMVRHAFDAATGMLSSDGMPPVRTKPGAGPRHFVFHPNNRRVYLLCETDASLYAFDYDARSGALHEIQIVNTLPPGVEIDTQHPNAHAADIHLTPDGRLLYVSVRISNTLAAFSIDPATGLLQTIGHYPTEAGPRAFKIDPSGRHLLALGGSSNTIASYEIDAESGILRNAKRYETGKYPNWIELIRL
jgi:6-phosphogluconolactonase